MSSGTPRKFRRNPISPEALVVAGVAGAGATDRLSGALPPVSALSAGNGACSTELGLAAAARGLSFDVSASCPVAAVRNGTKKPASKIRVLIVFILAPVHVVVSVSSTHHLPRLRQEQHRFYRSRPLSRSNR